jgi:RNA polymerase sigma-70 factor, ECF subfamily
MLHIQEKILVHRAQRGDQNAFAKLYDEYFNQIQRFVLFKISDKEKTEELINTIFTKTFQYLLKNEEIDNFRALLYQIARHAIIDFYRSQGQHLVSLDEIQEKNYNEQNNLDERIDIKIDLEKIKEALNKIPDHYKEVLVLRFVEELSFKEIGKMIDQKEATVRMIVHRGLKEMRRVLQNSQNQ